MIKESKIAHLSRLVRGMVQTGGIEVSDSVLRWSSWESGKWRFVSLRLPPGILLNGEIKKQDEFRAALAQFRTLLGYKRKKVRIPAVLTLSSVKIYTQEISLPILEEGKMNEALDLNLRMASPIPFEQAYASSELIRRDEDASKMDYLTAFIERATIDDLVKAFEDSGFLPVAIEPRSLSLARVIRKASTFEPNRSYIVMHLDTNGLEYLVIRNGSLYFDYFTLWQELEASDKEISLEGFRAVIVRGLHQVLNFYKTHWTEPIDSILLSSIRLGEDIQKIIEADFTLKVHELTLNLGQPVENEWMIALGAGFRGVMPRRNDAEISLLGIDAKEEYAREEVLGFLSFWRSLVPAALLFTLMIFSAVFLFLKDSALRVEQSVRINLSSSDAAEISNLQKKVTDFNSEVDMLSKLQASYPPKVQLLEELRPIADQYQIVINRVTYGPGNSITLNGVSKVNDAIVLFRKALEANPHIKSVNLSLSNIQPSPAGYSFSLTFIFAPSNVE